MYALVLRGQKRTKSDIHFEKADMDWGYYLWSILFFD